MIDRPGEYAMVGSTIRYNRTRYTEIITADGPTEEDLEVMVS